MEEALLGFSRSAIFDLACLGVSISLEDRPVFRSFDHDGLVGFPLREPLEEIPDSHSAGTEADEIVFLNPILLDFLPATVPANKRSVRTSAIDQIERPTAIADR
jgi:hypothetical protein